MHSDGSCSLHMSRGSHIGNLGVIKLIFRFGVLLFHMPEWVPPDGRDELGGWAV